MKRSGGFTVIEVVLFLAISGAMAIALLVGISAAIQRQQYRDAVHSFAGFFSDQYSKVLSVENDRQATDACPLSSRASERGQSDCVIVGRHVLKVAGQQRYVARTVIALRDGPASGPGQWRYALSSDSADYDVPWGVKTKLSGEAEEGPITFLLLRRPESGEVVLRIAGTVAESAQDITDLAGAHRQHDQEVCVYDDGWLQTERQSLFVKAHGGSTEAFRLAAATEVCRG